MKLVSFDAGKGHQLGVVEGGGVISLSAAGLPFTEMLDIVHGGDAALEQIRSAIAGKPIDYELTDVKLLAPVQKHGKYLAIGMNYQKHVEEAEKLGIDVPDKQVWFNKQTTCISGPYDPIEPGVTEMDL